MLVPGEETPIHCGPPVVILLSWNPQKGKLS
jgi:hypothetical protein